MQPLHVRAKAIAVDKMGGEISGIGFEQRMLVLQVCVLAHQVRVLLEQGCIRLAQSPARGGRLRPSLLALRPPADHPSFGRRMPSGASFRHRCLRRVYQDGRLGWRSPTREYKLNQSAARIL
jgi:hypothetical protein